MNDETPPPVPDPVDDLTVPDPDTEPDGWAGSDATDARIVLCLGCLATLIAWGFVLTFYFFR